VTNGPVQRDTTGDRTHPGRAGAGLCRRAASESAVPHAPRARDEAEPVLSQARRRGHAPVVRAVPGASVRVARAAGRDHAAPLGPAVGDNRWATLRCGAASLTETAGRAPFEQHAKAAGEDAR
jgi:hypothetical protein